MTALEDPTVDIELREPTLSSVEPPPPLEQLVSDMAKARAFYEGVAQSAARNAHDALHRVQHDRVKRARMELGAAGASVIHERLPDHATAFDRPRERVSARLGTREVRITAGPGDTWSWAAQDLHDPPRAAPTRLDSWPEVLAWICQPQLLSP